MHMPTLLFLILTPHRNVSLHLTNNIFPRSSNKEYGFLHLPTSMSAAGTNTGFFYSLIPNLFVPLDTTSLEEAGIIKAQTQPALLLSGKNILIGLIDTGIQYTHPAFLHIGKTYQNCAHQNRQFLLLPMTGLSDMELYSQKTILIVHWQVMTLLLLFLPQI